MGSRLRLYILAGKLVGRHTLGVTAPFIPKAINIMLARTGTYTLGVTHTQGYMLVINRTHAYLRSHMHRYSIQHIPKATR